MPGRPIAELPVRSLRCDTDYRDSKQAEHPEDEFHGDHVSRLRTGLEDAAPGGSTRLSGTGRPDGPLARGRRPGTGSRQGTASNPRVVARYAQGGMTLRSFLHLAEHAPGPLPESIRALEEIGGVRVVRLRGSVGREIGPQVDAADEAAAKTPGVFERPLLFDFKEATDVDSATVAYLIRALRRRVPAHVPVGIVNAPPKLVAELEISRVEPLFRLFRTEEEAIAELAAAAATLRKSSES